MNSQCMFTAAQYCHCDGKAICVPPFWSSSTFIWISLYLYCLQRSNFFYWQIRSTVVRLSIEFCTWQSKFEYILSCKLNFGIFLWMRERERERCVSLLWYFSAREMPFVALYRFCFWHFDPEEGFIRWLEVHFSVLRQKNLMNEPVPARSAVLLYRATRHHFSSTIPTFCRTLVMCTPVSIFFSCKMVIRLH